MNRETKKKTTHKYIPAFHFNIWQTSTGVKLSMMLKAFKGCKKYCYFVDKRNHSCWKFCILGNQSNAESFWLSMGYGKD